MFYWFMFVHFFQLPAETEGYFDNRYNRQIKMADSNKNKIEPTGWRLHVHDQTAVF